MARTQQSNGKDPNPTPEQMAAQIDTIREDIGTLTRLMTDYTRAKENELEARLKDGIEGAKAHGRQVATDARVRTERAGAQARARVAEQPATALGIAAGLGFLVGWLGRRS